MYPHVVREIMRCNLHEDDHHDGDGIIEVCFNVEVAWMDQQIFDQQILDQQLFTKPCGSRWMWGRPCTNRMLAPTSLGLPTSLPTIFPDAAIARCLFPRRLIMQFGENPQFVTAHGGALCDD